MCVDIYLYIYLHRRKLQVLVHKSCHNQAQAQHQLITLFVVLLKSICLWQPIVYLANLLHQLIKESGRPRVSLKQARGPSTNISTSLSLTLIQMSKNTGNYLAAISSTCRCSKNNCLYKVADYHAESIKVMVNLRHSCHFLVVNFLYYIIFNQKIKC